MREAVEEGCRELLIAGEDGDPFGKREIRRHNGRSSLIAVRDEIEEELPTDPIEGDESELIDDEYLDTSEAQLQTRELTRIACLE